TFTTPAARANLTQLLAKHIALTICAIALANSARPSTRAQRHSGKLPQLENMYLVHRRFPKLPKRSRPT
ncbi:MAG TPA: hypothetical protein VFB24_01220, partial [Candidatus Binatia bacterium]|nr:hypothetical protein [Candidatus Binatia bacterium]